MVLQSTPWGTLVRSSSAIDLLKAKKMARLPRLSGISCHSRRPWIIVVDFPDPATASTTRHPSPKQRARKIACWRGLQTRVGGVAAGRGWRRDMVCPFQAGVAQVSLGIPRLSTAYDRLALQCITQYRVPIDPLLSYSAARTCV